MGQMISEFGRKLRDINIKKMTVSLIAHTGCNRARWHQKWAAGNQARGRFSKMWALLGRFYIA